MVNTFQKVPRTSYSSYLLWILIKDPVCASSNTVLEDNNLPPIAFFHKLIPMQDVGYMFHLNVARQLPSLSKFKHHWVISYQWQRCWPKQAISIWHWFKQNIASSKNEGREAWHTFFTTYQNISKRSKDMDSLAVNYALD